MNRSGTREEERRRAAAREYLASVQLTGLQALKAVENFLGAEYRGLEIGLLLGEISLQGDDLPTDPHTLIWWREAVEKAVEATGVECPEAYAAVAALRLTGLQAMTAMENFLDPAYVDVEGARVLDEIALQPDGTPNHPQTLARWRNAVDDALKEGPTYSIVPLR